VILSVLLCFVILTDAAEERMCLSIFQAGVFCLAIAWGIARIFGRFHLAGHVLMIPLSVVAAKTFIEKILSHWQLPAALLVLVLLATLIEWWCK
jgi:hypothetical protein